MRSSILRAALLAFAVATEAMAGGYVGGVGRIAQQIDRIRDLRDVGIASLSDGDLLVYEAASAKWKNRTLAALGLPTGSVGSDDNRVLRSSVPPGEFQPSEVEIDDSGNVTTPGVVNVGTDGGGATSEIRLAGASHPRAIIIEVAGTNFDLIRILGPADTGQAGSIDMTAFTTAGIRLQAGKFVLSKHVGTNAVVYQINDATTAGFGQGSNTANPAILRGSAPQVEAADGETYVSTDLHVGRGGTGTESEVWLAGVGGNGRASMQMRNYNFSNGTVTDGVPYDSIAFYTPGSPGLPSSVESLVITSQELMLPSTHRVSARRTTSGVVYGIADTSGFNHGLGVTGTRTITLVSNGGVSLQADDTDVRVGTNLPFYIQGDSGLLQVGRGGTGAGSKIQMAGDAGASSASNAITIKANQDAASNYDQVLVQLPNAAGTASAVDALKITTNFIDTDNWVANLVEYASDHTIEANEFFTAYQESTGTAVTVPSAATMGSGWQFIVLNNDPEGDDIAITSASGSFVVMTNTVAAGLTTLGTNTDTSVSLVERGAWMHCVSNGTNYRCLGSPGLSGT